MSKLKLFQIDFTLSDWSVVEALGILTGSRRIETQIDLKLISVSHVDLRF